MKHLIILLLALVLVPCGESAAQSQQLLAGGGCAVVIYKYDRMAGILERTSRTAPYESVAGGKIHRSFPTGPKVCFGDERIPEGIYRARILPREENDGRVTEAAVEIVFQTLPGLFETYRLSGPSLDRNVIPLHKEFLDELTSAAVRMHRAGYREIPVVILPGDLEAEVADKLRQARNVRPWQSLDAVEASCRRWKPVEEYLQREKRIPRISFDGADIVIHPPEESGEGIARR